MKTRILTFILVLQTAFAFGQNYTTSLGVRIGNEVGISLQQRLFKSATLEGIVHTNFKDRATVTALLETHQKLIGRGLNFYVGGGIHKGWEEEFSNPIGVDAIIGLELTLLRINASIDYKPAFNFYGGSRIIQHQTGVSIRYVLIKAKKQKKKKGKKGNKGKGLFN
jgi:hypothetical protein